MNNPLAESGERTRASLNENFSLPAPGAHNAKRLDIEKLLLEEDTNES